ncbi:hypothetical protein [Kitasatospora sp. NPDC058190]|uniref:hypothetical protein n=1 Tax=Kitasatospora sp. NPDC058190 TaxID=3346371 RepID=UPI0036DE4343
MSEIPNAATAARLKAVVVLRICPRELNSMLTARLPRGDSPRPSAIQSVMPRAVGRGRGDHHEQPRQGQEYQRGERQRPVQQLDLPAAPPSPPGDLRQPMATQQRAGSMPTAQPPPRGAWPASSPGE